VLRVIGDHVEGLRLPDLLQEAQRGGIQWPFEAVLALSAEIVRVAASFQRASGLAHGAITPAHIVVSRKGPLTLTDGSFGPAFEVLGRNRSQLWREFGVALPVSATLPRFDRRGDVAALGATVLAVLLGRTLEPEEYPRGVEDLIAMATPEAKPGKAGSAASVLRMWLQHAFGLRRRSTLATAVDAEQAFAEVEGPPMTRRAAAVALRSTLRRISGDTEASARAASLAEAWSHPAVAHSPATSAPPDEAASVESVLLVPEEPARRRLDTLLRSVFHNFKAN
jgi:hypothetical protein